MDTTPVYGLYTKNTLVWIEDKQLVWRCCRLKSDIKPGDSEIQVEDYEDASFQLTVKIVTSPVKSTDLKDVTCKLPALKNPDILIGANDLTSLSYLHEPAGMLSLPYFSLFSCTLLTPLLSRLHSSTQSASTLPRSRCYLYMVWHRTSSCQSFF